MFLKHVYAHPPMRKFVQSAPRNANAIFLTGRWVCVCALHLRREIQNKGVVGLELRIMSDTRVRGSIYLFPRRELHES